MSDILLIMSDVCVVIGVMREITVRELLRNFKGIYPIQEDGIRVKSRDGDDFYIYPNVRQDVRQDVRHSSTSLVENSTVPIENTGGLTTFIDFCRLNRAHPFIKGQTYPVAFITKEDAEGRMVIDHVTMCADCLKIETSKVEREGGVLYCGTKGQESRLLPL